MKTFYNGMGDIISILTTQNSKHILFNNYLDLKLYDIKTGKDVKTFKGHINSVSSVAISQNGKYALSGSWDGTVRYWNIKTGKELLKTISFTDGEWLSITPEGYFNASKNGAKHLNILTAPMEVSSIDQYYETFYRPDIVASVMSELKISKY